MEKYENTQARETTNDIIVHELTDKDSSSTFVKEYLKAGFVSTAVDRLFYARRQAELTQAEVAERMNTKQAAIARLEADINGSMSLRRYAEFALSCGMVPLEITLVPIESARNFVIANPDLPLTQVNYDTWLLTKETPTIPASQYVQGIPIPASQYVQGIPISASQYVQGIPIPASQYVQGITISASQYVQGISTVDQTTNITPRTTKPVTQNILENSNQLQEGIAA